MVELIHQGADPDNRLKLIKKAPQGAFLYWFRFGHRTRVGLEFSISPQQRREFLDTY